MNQLKRLNDAMNGRDKPARDRLARMNAVGWHPAPNGQPELWYWNGAQWIDPIANIEDQITELIEPHLERMYVAGFNAGFNQGSRMNQCP